MTLLGAPSTFPDCNGSLVVKDWCSFTVPFDQKATRPAPRRTLANWLQLKAHAGPLCESRASIASILEVAAKLVHSKQGFVASPLQDGASLVPTKFGAKCQQFWLLRLGSYCNTRWPAAPQAATPPRRMRKNVSHGVCYWQPSYMHSY